MGYGSRMADDGGTSLRRGLRTLEVLAGADGDGDRGLGVVDVARRLGVDKSQASRTLRALAEHGLAERDAVSAATASARASSPMRRSCPSAGSCARPRRCSTRSCKRWASART